MSHDSAPAEILLKAIKDGDWTFRSLGRAMRIPFKSVIRYANGESPIPLRFAPKFAEQVFHRAADRHRFILCCQRFHNESDKSKQQRREIRKAYTQVKIRYMAFAGQTATVKPDVLHDKRGVILRSTFTDVERGAYVCVFDKLQPRKNIIEIRSREGFIFIDHNGNTMYGYRALEQYRSFCKDRGISWYGLLELAKRSLAVEGAFDDAEFRMGEKRIMDVEEMKRIMATLQHVENILQQEKVSVEEVNRAILEIQEAKSFFDNDDQKTRKYKQDKAKLMTIIGSLLNSTYKPPRAANRPGKNVPGLLYVQSVPKLSI